MEKMTDQEVVKKTEELALEFNRLLQECYIRKMYPKVTVNGVWTMTGEVTFIGLEIYSRLGGIQYVNYSGGC